MSMDGGEQGMRLLRGLGGALLWIVSLLLILVGVILCVTVILLPVGIPLLGYAGRLFGSSIRLMLPRAVAHPVKSSDKAMDKQGRTARKRTAHTVKAAKRNVAASREWGRKKAKRARKKLPLIS